VDNLGKLYTGYAAMLLKFQVTNHRSIRGTAEISFVATSLKEQSESLVPCRYTKHGVLPVLALYGANASGKSNLLDAMAFFRRTILRSFVEGDTDSGMEQKPFLLDEESRKQASTYIADFVFNGIRHQYGFSMTSERVVEEWLYQFPKAPRQILFHRKADEEAEFFFGRYLKGKNREVEAITPDNTLFLSAAIKAGHIELSPIAAYFRNAIQFRLNPSVVPVDLLGRSLIKDAMLKSEVSRYLTIADTGIMDVNIEKESTSVDDQAIASAVFETLTKFHKFEELNPLFQTPEHRFQVILGHQSEDGKTRPLNFDDESLGTKYLLTILIPMLKVLQEGKLLVLDEITTSLHTLLARKLVTLFMDPKINTKGAQLLFTTHDTNLLAPGLLRRDQVWFAEKSPTTGETVIYPLSDIKTKNTDNIERGYIQGRFGGIPFIPDNQPLC
jgi:AAA15 family ATPase/GTPase